MADPTSYLSPYMIQGGLNFGNAPGLEDYQSAYENALNLNKSNYSNILSGYQGLTSSVLGNLQGVAAGQAQAIADTYAQQQGAATQGLISKGLGNTTVQSAVNRGIALDRTKAQNNLQSQIADLYARYQSQLGGNMLNWMNSVSAPYPDPRMYAQLAMNRGMLAAMQRGVGQGTAGLGATGYRMAGTLPPLRGMGSVSAPAGGGGGYAGAYAPYSMSSAQPSANWQRLGGEQGIGGGGSWGVGPFASQGASAYAYGGGQAEPQISGIPLMQWQGLYGANAPAESWMEPYKGWQGFDPNEFAGGAGGGGSWADQSPMMGSARSYGSQPVLSPGGGGGFAYSGYPDAAANFASVGAQAFNYGGSQPQDVVDSTDYLSMAPASNYFQGFSPYSETYQQPTSDQGEGDWYAQNYNDYEW